MDGSGYGFCVQQNQYFASMEASAARHPFYQQQSSLQLHDSTVLRLAGPQRGHVREIALAECQAMLPTDAGLFGLRARVVLSIEPDEIARLSASRPSDCRTLWVAGAMGTPKPKDEEASLEVTGGT